MPDVLRPVLRPVLRDVLGRPLTPIKGGGVAYEAEATALFARFTTPPTDARKGHINTLIKALKDAGIWSKLDALYLLAAADAQAARRNWKADAYNLTAVSSPTFTADRGYAGDGSSSYLDTSLVPSTFGGLFAQNNAAFGFWSRTTRAGISTNPMGAASGSNSPPFSIINTRFTDDRLYAAANDGGGGGGGTANTQTAGLFAIDRNASDTYRVYRDGSLLDTKSVASTGLPSNSFALLARRTGTGAILYTTDQLAMAFVGQSLGSDQAAFKSAVETYLTAVGAV